MLSVTSPTDVPVQSQSAISTPMAPLGTEFSLIMLWYVLAPTQSLPPIMREKGTDSPSTNRGAATAPASDLVSRERVAREQVQPDEHPQQEQQDSTAE